LQPPRRDEERASFRSALREQLEPYFDVCGQHVAVEEIGIQQDEYRDPWFFLAISRHDRIVPVDASLLREAMVEADRHSASRIIVSAPAQQGLLLGMLNQRRWWTLTRARLCGQHILRHFLDAFALPEDP